MVPAATPVTTPLPLMVAADVLELDHVPPPVLLPCVTLLPGQTMVGPIITDGAGNTEAVMVLEKTGLVTKQPTLLSILHDTVLPLVSVLFE